MHSSLKMISAQTCPPPGRAFRDWPSSWLSPARSNLYCLSLFFCWDLHFSLVPTVLCTIFSPSLLPVDKDAVRSETVLSIIRRRGDSGSTSEWRGGAQASW